jgi:two-component system NtrC family sensor kinase
MHNPSLLIISQDPNFEKDTHPQIQGAGWISFSSKDKKEILTYLLNRKFDLVFLDLDSGEQLQAYSDILQKNPAFFHLAVIYSQTEQLAYIPSQLPIQRAFAKKDISQLENYLKNIGEQNKIQKEKNALLQTYHEQNRKLQRIQQDLEVLVDERVRNIDASKFEEQKTQKHVQGLTRYLQNLSMAEDLEDLLEILREEWKQKDNVANIFLVYQNPELETIMASIQDNIFVQKKIYLDVPDMQMQRTHHPEDRKFLANAWQRPILNVIAFPLAKSSFGTKILFLETALNENQWKEQHGNWQEWLQPFEMSVEQILWSEAIYDESRKWEKTFSALQEPLAVYSQTGELIRYNQKFHDQLKERILWSDLQNTDTEFLLKVDTALFEVKKFPIKTADYFIFFFIEVTEERRLYSQWIQNEKMAALGLLAGNIAHELNNPIAGILSLSELLIEDLPEEVALQEDLKQIMQAAIRCKDTIRNLQDFSQKNSKMQVVSLNRMVSKTLQLLKTALRNHSLFLELADSEELPVLVNPHLLQQVLFNLIQNACQAMVEKGTLTLKTYQENDQIVFSVEDTGVGIAPENLSKIFEPFYTTKEEGRGTGLGLHFAKNVVESFNGTISVRSKLQVGTSFSISFPLFSERGHHENFGH